MGQGLLMAALCLPRSSASTLAQEPRLGAHKGQGASMRCLSSQHSTDANAEGRVGVTVWRLGAEEQDPAEILPPPSAWQWSLACPKLTL